MNEHSAPARTLSGQTAFFLAGDSYPEDEAIHREVRLRLGRLFAAWRSQADISALAETDGLDIGARLAALDRAIGASAAGRSQAVLIGRSSGARVATLYAASRPVRAVICLGYPFQVPGKDRDPERVGHLPRLRTPTLILQGRFDRYNGPGGYAAFPVSDSVTIHDLDGDHELRLSKDAWDRACDTIAAFCVGPPPRSP